MRAPASMPFEVTTTMVKLRPCTGCGARHPLAYKPIPADPSVCPECGVSASVPGAPRLAKTTLTLRGAWGGIARALFAFAAYIRNLAKEF